MKILCSNCNQRLEIPEELAGQTIECPACNASLSVSAPEAPPPVSPSKIQLATPKASPPSSRSKPSLTEGDKSVLKNYAGEIARHESGSEQQMAAIHTVGLLAGSKTEYKQTSVVFVRSLIGGVILIVLILIGQWIRSDPWENSTVKAHRKITSINSALGDKLKAGESVDAYVNAINSAVSKLEKIDVDDLPQEYGDSLFELIKGLKGMSIALKRGDLEKADEYSDMMIDAARRLKEIMKAKGRY
jgi:hypothetical protein